MRAAPAIPAIIRRVNLPYTESRKNPGWPLYLLHVALPVIVGAAIYVLFRSPRLRVFHWLQAVGLGGAVEAARGWARPAAEYLAEWLLYSAPDGLWVYGLTACLALVWRGEPGRTRRAWLCVGVAPGSAVSWGSWRGGCRASSSRRTCSFASWAGARPSF